MREIKFSTAYEQVLSFADKDFRMKYEERVGTNRSYEQESGGELKHFAVCPRCNNPVVILGIYKKIDVAPHARHASGVNLPGVAQFNEYKYLHCPYHVKKANYVREYVPETDEPEREELKGKWYSLRATGYRYAVGKDDALSEWLRFSILKLDDTSNESHLNNTVDRFELKVDPYHFGNLVNYKDWKPQQKLLDIANKYMG